MSSTAHPAYAVPAMPGRHPVPAASLAGAGPPVPAGTFASGTKVQVGNHRVVIEKYLSEGGFAHVYLVRLPKPVDGEEKAVLKRVAVPDKESLAGMKTEVETMKKLKGHHHIVKYIDSHASQLKGGGYEVFLLMEYCGGGGLIDYMNTRLQNRLTEPEILKIFSDVAQGVACMHYLKPPLLHRDLKVENILISSADSSRQFKLCDFGSTAAPRSAATTAAEGRLIEDDVQKHTTLQYRSPEMIDVYRKQPIDEKSDVWALGVLLYKLCYYTTPFEELGQMAILNASFKFPGYPTFTDRTKKLIASMLREKPALRPNIYQVVCEVCLMRGTDVPIRDIYTGQQASESRRNQQLPAPPSNTTSLPVAGVYKSAASTEKPSIPDITPMRRGRPISTSADHPPPKPSPSPMRVISNDPFAALDSTPNVEPDSSLLADASARFPPLDKFSLLQESNGKFAFDKKPPQTTSKPKDISQRVTEALADDAFALPVVSMNEPLTHTKSLPATVEVDRSLKSTVAKRVATKAARPPSMQQPTPIRPTMVSIGTMTSPSPPPLEKRIASQVPPPVFKFPPSDHQRAASQPGIPDRSGIISPSSGSEHLLPKRPSLSDHRMKSQASNLSITKHAPPSRLSLESERPSDIDIDMMTRSRSTNSRSQPASANVESSRRFLRGRSSSRGKTPNKSPSPRPRDAEHVGPEVTRDLDGGVEPSKISSNVEFLRAMEEEEPTKRKEKRNSSGSKHIKRASMPSISLSGTKSLLAGRFGEAFRRFETNTSGSGLPLAEQAAGELTPIAGSEATDDRSDDGQVMEETEATPEFRRELERRRLSQEERRVADAAAAYKQRVAERGADAGRPAGGQNTRAALIQNKVQALLHENNKSPTTKTAEGYGRFTDEPKDLQARRSGEIHASGTFLLQDHTIGNKPPVHIDLPLGRPQESPISSVSAPPTERSFARPSAPPKPHALRTGGRGEPVGSTISKSAGLTDKPRNLHPESGPGDSDDWETNFSKRYPSLSGLEMVETEIDKGTPVGLSTRDV